MTEDPASEQSDAGQGLAECLLAWLSREAPNYLAYLQQAFGARTPHEALAVYFRRGDEGGPFIWAGNYLRYTGGRRLHFDTAELLRRWVDEALIAGAVEVRWRPDDPDADWAGPLRATQLRRLHPRTAPGSAHSELDLMHELKTLLPDLHAGMIDFGGRKYLCRVFARLSPAERTDHSAKAEVEARPAEGLASKSQPARQKQTRASTAVAPLLKALEDQLGSRYTEADVVAIVWKTVKDDRKVSQGTAYRVRTELLRRARSRPSGSS